MKSSSHSLFEDLLALICAGVFVALGIVLFKSQGLLTGGAAGIALLGSHATDISFGTLFFLVNLPFYTLAWTQIGKRFTLNTFIAVSLVSFLSEHMDKVFVIDHIHPAFASLLAGMLVGVGLLIMFRHKSSLGGFGILAFYLQQRFNIRAGKLQLSLDVLILLIAATYFSFELLIYSLIGAVIMNLVLAANHKPGRYQTDVSAPQQQIEQETLTELHEELQEECNEVIETELLNSVSK